VGRTVRAEVVEAVVIAVADSISPRSALVGKDLTRSRTIIRREERSRLSGSAENPLPEQRTTADAAGAPETCEIRSAGEIGGTGPHGRAWRTYRARLAGGQGKAIPGSPPRAKIRHEMMLNCSSEKKVHPLRKVLDRQSRLQMFGDPDLKLANRPWRGAVYHDNRVGVDKVA
jgi:hypothetical protein